MKRNFASKPLLLSLLLFNASILTSCSSQLLSRGQTIDSAQQGNVQVTVPKEQYDELARKYQELLAASKKSVAQTAPDNASVSDSNTQFGPQVAEPTTLDPSELVNRIDSALPDVAKIDTVDALNPETKTGTAKSGPPVPTSMGIEQVNVTDDIDEQISQLRQVQELIKVNKFDQGLGILKELENSKEKQIVVRAKIMLADLLFNQGEYDLASQVYEEVIKKYAFSGFVLKALGRLVVCSEKLKQPERQAKYYSLLHDFFEAG